MPSSMFFVGDPPPPFFRGTGPVFPNQDLVSMDDEQIKAILLNLDIHTLFEELKMSVPYFRAATDDRHPTHRFLIVRWTGNKRDRDNGYMLYGWRRSHHSFHDVERYMREFVDQAAINPVAKWVGGPKS